MIKAAIFDLNGIFIQSPKLSERFEKDFHVDKNIFAKRLEEVMSELRKPGAKPAFEYWGPVLKEFNVTLTEEEFWNYWFLAEIPSKEMIQYATTLRSRGIKVFILSNNFRERSEFYNQYDWIHDVVDKVYFSWQTGFIKPDVRAWRLILSENNLAASECIFFDDKEENLEAARKVGIKPYMFTNVEDLVNITNIDILNQ
jgi:HAD superfamily hydrolase (TIGR01509 family)